jgi:hypothetical protein
MVIFVLETIVLPILFVWALFGIGRSAFEAPTLRMVRENNDSSR